MFIQQKKRKDLNKIILSLVVTSSLFVAAQASATVEELNEDISEAKKQKKAIEDKIKKLEDQLPHTKLVARAELGFMQTQGNTNTDIFSLDLNVKKGWSKVHLVGFSLDAQYATDNKVETKNKYTAELEYNYLFTDRLSATYLLGYKRDKFSGYDYQLYTGPGAKYTFIKAQDHKLSFEGNILFSEDQIEKSEYDINGNNIPYPNPKNITVASSKRGYSEDYGAYRVKGVYEWQIFSNLKFDQDLSYRSEIEDAKVFFVNSKSALTTKFNSTFSAGISYKIDYVNTPPAGKEDMDRTFTANLSINY